ncbi:hypothetical protein QM092_19525 [Enterobacter hormaechei]|uniref:hypothetical protein n=1 Tax=Enterobacter hormaechei TaxID=158836 RepID=UPI000643119B|nr:hypothetical protein [Enterobacter hormaechei]KLR12156.1 hypothetical protein ABR27_18180 [Enterobacter hormaechei subsp. hormaechei]MDV5372173.1 hypothetical protein [Enterobacter hormaechei]RTP13134.1 hypothetical protein EKN51_16145 [Enterobacter hormaechei]HBV5204353.1 hypothetical protein [Enterobacter hormaechei]HEM8699778.1 hypothetical protein [Enterobacter hormaechei]
MQHLNIKGFVMGVYRDRQGNYVTTENPTESHRNITDAYISEDTHRLKSDPSRRQAEFEGNLAISRFIGIVMLICFLWAAIFYLILIPGLNSAGMLIYNGGILGIVGQIIWIIFKAAFTLLTVPMMVAGIVSPYDPGTHYISQAVVMAVVSGIIFKFRKNVKKPIVSTLGFLAICTCVSIGLVATNADLWSQFQMFPNL